MEDINQHGWAYRWLNHLVESLGSNKPSLDRYTYITQVLSAIFHSFPYILCDMPFKAIMFTFAFTISMLMFCRASTNLLFSWTTVSPFFERTILGGWSLDCLCSIEQCIRHKRNTHNSLISNWSFWLKEMVSAWRSWPQRGHTQNIGRWMVQQ